MIPVPVEKAPEKVTPPPRCLLGTSYALGRGPGRSADLGDGPWTGARVVERAQRADAAGLYLCHGLPPDLQADTLRAVAGRGDDLPLRALDAECGAAVLGEPRKALAELSSEDRDEAAVALAVISAALQLAVERGAAQVVLRLGSVRAVRGRWDKLRRRFLRGELLEDPTLAERVMTERQAAAQRQLGPCLRGLERALQIADRRGVTLLLRNPRRGIDLPGPMELRVICEELRGAPLAPLLDLPAAHLCSTMRLVALRDTIGAFGSGPLAALGDACGAVGALPVGHGEVNVAVVARALPKSAGRAFLPWPGLHEHEVVAGYRSVAAL